MSEIILYEDEKVNEEFKSFDLFCIYDNITGEYLINPDNWLWDGTPKKSGLFHSQEKASEVMAKITEVFVQNGETKIDFEIVKCKVIESEIIRTKIVKL